jgi:peptidoglycan hydrolase CwlO-like protein
MAPKKYLKITSPNKPPERSTMTHEENEDIQNQISKLDSQIIKLNDKSVKKVDFMTTQA